MEIRKHNRYDYVPLVDRVDYVWPGNKRLAVCICNNIEVFSFLSGLGSDSATVGAAQTTRNYAWRDYGNRVGMWYLFNLLDEYGLPASHNVNSRLLAQCPQILKRIQTRGDEIIAHGRSNAERQDVLDEAGEKALIDDATDEIHRLSGNAPRGWLGPYVAQTAVTLDLLKEAGYQYVMDWPADDQPFWMRTRSGPILSVPYSIEVNDSPSMVFRQESAMSFERMMIDQFDEMFLQSAKWPLVFTIVIHPFIMGYPFRLRALRRALTHILSYRDHLWLTTPGEIAKYCESLPKGTIPGR